MSEPLTSDEIIDLLLKATGNPTVTTTAENSSVWQFTPATTFTNNWTSDMGIKIGWETFFPERFLRKRRRSTGPGVRLRKNRLPHRRRA